MKVTKKDLKQYFKLPYTMQDFFVIETLDAFFSITESIFEDFYKKFKIKVSCNQVKETVLHDIIQFHNRCMNCENDCFYHYHKRLPNDTLQQMKIDEEMIPKSFKQKRASHLYMLELTLGICSSVNNYLKQYTQNEEALEYAYFSFYFLLLHYFEDNCIKECKYKCFKNCYDDAYCRICTLMDEDLACPLKNEVSLKDIKEEEFNDECMKERE